MRCFVTGGTGFIGSYVVKSLVEAGIEVVALYHSKSTSRWLDEMLTEEERELLVLEQGDMTDAERIRKLIVDYGCDSVAHLASRLNQKTRANPTDGVQTNIVAFQNLLEICKMEKLRRLTNPRAPYRNSHGDILPGLNTRFANSARGFSTDSRDATWTSLGSSPRVEQLLERIASKGNVIVLDSGELVGATYNQYDERVGNKTALQERWAY